MKKAAAIGSPTGDQMAASLAPRLSAVADDPNDDTVGAALLALVAHARDAGVDPEMALRMAVADASVAVRAFEGETPGT